MSKKHEFDYIFKFVHDKGFTLLSKEYLGKNFKLDIQCHIHGQFASNFDVFRKSIHGCPKCGYEKGGAKNSLTLDQVKKEITALGYIPLFSKYDNAKKKLSVECPKHGEFSANFSNLKSGKKCYQCGREETSKKNSLNAEEVIKRIKDKGFKLISNYVSATDPMEVECPKHGLFKATLQNFMYGNGCQKCSKGRSKSQDQLSDLIKNLGLKIIENDRNAIAPAELDIYIPALNIGIEYCGLYWHSEKFKGIKYHFDKMNACNNKGIRLITIFEDEWLERKNQVMSFLKSALQKNKNKIYARKTVLKQVDKKEAFDFLKKNHIQGSAKMDVAFGLYFEHKLLGIVTASKHHRQGHADSLVLNRLAFEENYSISGGSSKLLNHLIKYAKEKGFSSIISWSDNRWSEGNVYAKLGFLLDGELGPDYSYVIREKRISKQSCKKNNLIKKGAVGKTEKEMAISLGYSRIWDCGKKRWSYEI